MPDTEKPSTAGVAAAAPPAAEDDWTGRSLGEFQILRLVGRGGMGRVFLAEQRSLKRKVALKILRPDLAANKTALQRFQKEAEAVAKLTHANIVHVYGIGEQDGVHYMALEYVEGRNLRDYLHRKGPPDLPVAISIMRQIAAALQRASEAGFVHRDIKPENILLTRKGEVKVADFGLTRCFSETGQPLNLTQSGVAMGTPLYMSPEQVQGKLVDHRSDIYSFGVTCYHMFSGQPPFRGSNAFDVALKHVQEQPPPLANFRPDLPAEMCALVHKMMAKKPEERFESCREIQRELSHIRDQYAAGAAVQPALHSGVMGAADYSTLTAQATSAFDELPAVVALPPHRPWLKWVVVALVLVGALLGGAAVRAVRNRSVAPEAAKAKASAPPATPLLSEEERFLLDAVKRYPEHPDSRSDMAKLKEGLGFQIDLGVLYLRDHRLDDAEKFFRSLTDSNRPYRRVPLAREHPYRVFGRFGLALLMGYRDQANESIAELQRLVSIEQTGNAAIAINGIWPVEHLELRKVVAEVLNRNAANLKLDKYEQSSFEHLRKPPVVFAKPDRLLPRIKDGK